jgi:hypothetical protein
MLGLQLDKYVPGGAAALDAPGWAGAVARQGAMLSMFTDHVAAPLLAAAHDAPAPAHSGPLLMPEGALGWLEAWLPPAGSPQRRHVVAAATVAAAVAAVAAAALYARHRARGGGGGGARLGARR